MAPHIRIDVEIGGPVLLVSGIVPEVDGHRGGRRRADEFALLVDHRLAVLVKGLDLHRKAPALELS